MPSFFLPRTTIPSRTYAEWTRDEVWSEASLNQEVINDERGIAHNAEMTREDDACGRDALIDDEDKNKEAERIVETSPLSHIPPNQRIQVLYVDESVVVVNKPGGLRSVPGVDRRDSLQASSEHVVNDDVDGLLSVNNEQMLSTTAQRTTVTTPAEAWVLALKSFRSREKDVGKSDCDPVVVLLRSLSHLPDQRLASIPRKRHLFFRYLNSNSRRLQQVAVRTKSSSSVPRENDSRPGKECKEGCWDEAHRRLQERQREYQNLPPQTPPEESALGQLSLLKLTMNWKSSSQTRRDIIAGEHSESQDLPATSSSLYVVHRLDCETSGVLVFARSRRSAQSLSRAWHDRHVTKVYHALVNDWPLYTDARTENGRIDMALQPVTDPKSIRWRVTTRADPIPGKQSTTHWRVLGTFPRMGGGSSMIRLELIPVTGRTHQLRIHCAAVGGGVVGDSLYGASALQSQRLGSSEGHVSSAAPNQSPRWASLKLHAYKLRFPHPVDGRTMEFVVDPDW